MKVLLSFVLSCLLSLPALAGVRYTMRLETEDGAKKSYLFQNSLLQDDKAKLCFDEGVNAESEVDADGYGSVAYSVDVNSRRTTRLVLGKHELKTPVLIGNIVTTKTLQEAGPIILGHPTTHYRFTTDFDYNENNDSQKGTMIHDLWVASDMAEFDVMNWLMFQYRLRQDKGVESLFREVSTLGRGLPLAYDGIARIHDLDGNIRVIRLGATVETVERVNVDPSVFSVASPTYEVIAGR
jgi:hypothetical protein